MSQAHRTRNFRRHPNGQDKVRKIIPWGQRKAILEARRIAFGAIDEHNHSWVHEAEAKSIVHETSKGYQPTWLEAANKNVWRSSRGYFRLWRHNDGTTGLVFGFNYDDLDVVKIPGSAEQGSVRYGLKNPNRHVFLVTTWPKGYRPKFGDIEHAINQYTYEARTAIADEAILYETDPYKGVFRAGGMAYVFEFFDDGTNRKHFDKVVGEIRFYDKFVSVGLVNPFGRNVLDRAWYSLDNGVRLFELEHEREEKGRVKPAELERGERLDRARWAQMSYGQYQNARDRNQAEEFMVRNWLGSSLSYLYDDDVVSKEDKKFNDRYYKVKGGAKAVLAVAKQGQYYFRMFRMDNAAAMRSTATNLAGAGRGLVQGVAVGGGGIITGIAMAGLSLTMAGMTVMGMIKPSVDRKLLVDLKDPVVQEYSRAEKRVKAFRTIQRRFNSESDRFKSGGTFLITPTFDDVQPVTPTSDDVGPVGKYVGIKTASTLEELAVDLIEPAIQERGRSFVRFLFDKNAVSSTNRGEDIRAHKVLRTDGIITVKFRHENITWTVYPGQPLDEKHPYPPPSFLLEQFRPGFVVQIDKRRNAPRRISYIHLSQADRFLREEFDMPLIEPWIKQPAAVKMVRKQREESRASLGELQAAFAETSDELVKVARANRDLEKRKALGQTSQDVFVEAVRKAQNWDRYDRSGLFYPAVEALTNAIDMLEDRGIKYEFWHNKVPGVGHTLEFYARLTDAANDKQQSIHLRLTFPDQKKIVIRKLNNGTSEPFENNADVDSFVREKLAGIPIKVRGLKKRLLNRNLPSNQIKRQSGVQRRLSAPRPQVR